MRISDWSSDVCSSDLHGAEADILAGKVDFFVGPFQAESTTRSLRVETLFENRRSVIAREGHPLANATSLSDLRDARWVRPSFSDSREEADFDQVFERAKQIARASGRESRCHTVEISGVAVTIKK